MQQYGKVSLEVDRKTLLLVDPPGPPRNLQIENLTKTSCTLVWEKPSFDGGSKIIGYFVEKSTGYRYDYLIILNSKGPLHNVTTSRITMESSQLTLNLILSSK